MRIIFPYTYDEFDRKCLETLQDAVRILLKQRPAVIITVEPVLVDDRHDYAHLLEDVWDAPDDLVIVERDIDINANVLRTFIDCEFEWCAFPYEMAGGDPQTGLGCVRFRANRPRGIWKHAREWFSQQTPQDPLHWTQQDRILFSELTRLGMSVHRHEPAVHHWHFERETA